MQIETKCPECGAKHSADSPEGQLSAWFRCECGEVFGEFIIAEPFAKSFYYGMEALRRKRHTMVATHFATSFELCQKAVVELLLIAKGTPRELAHFIAHDLQLPKHKLRQIAEHLTSARLRVPDLGSRNDAVHSGEPPTLVEVRSMGGDVSQAMSMWIDALMPWVGADLARLESARAKQKPLPRDVEPYDRSVFDLRTSRDMVLAEWAAVVPS